MINNSDANQISSISYEQNSPLFYPEAVVNEHQSPLIKSPASIRNNANDKISHLNHHPCTPNNGNCAQLLGLDDKLGGGELHVHNFIPNVFDSESNETVLKIATYQCNFRK